MNNKSRRKTIDILTNRKTLGTFVGFLVYLFCILFFTYAYYTWRSSDSEVELAITDSAATIEFENGGEVKVKNIGPVLSYTDGVKATFKATNETEEYIDIKIKMQILSISEELLTSDFKYMIVRDTSGGTNYNYNSPVGIGDFGNFEVGTNYLGNNTVPPGATYSYQVIFYLDGSVENDINIQNGSLISILYASDYLYLSEVEPGSYVDYTGDNGCEGAACKGQNANYVNDTNMGYCYQQTGSSSIDTRFTVNGWRIIKQNNNGGHGYTHLISAGAPECVSTFIETRRQIGGKITLELGYINTRDSSGYAVFSAESDSLSGQLGIYNLDLLYDGYDVIQDERSPKLGYYYDISYFSFEGYNEFNFSDLGNMVERYCSGTGCSWSTSRIRYFPSSRTEISGLSGDGYYSMVQLNRIFLDESDYNIYGEFTEFVLFDYNQHLNNLNDQALKYCNTDYSYGGVCDNTTAWAMNEADFIENNYSSNVEFRYCYKQSNNNCGLGNDLIDNGGWYWFADVESSGILSERERGYVWYASDSRVGALDPTYNLGLRPVLKLDPGVIVTGGNGTYKNPYKLGVEGEDLDGSKPNSPNLDGGSLIPVYYDEDTETWKKADSSNKANSWYDYNNKRWANAVLIKDSTKRSTYQSASIGTAVAEADISGFFVWIPRFKYRVWNITREPGDETTYSYPAYTEGIDIMWEKGTSSTGNVRCAYNISNIDRSVFSDECSVDNTIITFDSINTDFSDVWYTHPAFNFNNSPRTGFWFGKFETTGSATAPTVLPEVIALTTQSISEKFTTSRIFQSYGLSSDINAHMLTNLEWGAMAYLTHSFYGLCAEGICRDVYVNNSENMITGRSSGFLPSSSSSNEYGDYNYKGYQIDSSGVVSNVKDITKVASSTGNITGIYDISGGSGEVVMANMLDATQNFNPKEAGNNWDGQTTLNPFYYNAYSYSSSSVFSRVKAFAYLGDATAEVFGPITTTVERRRGVWQPGIGMIGVESEFFLKVDPWLFRGGEAYYLEAAGSFGFYAFDGSWDVDYFYSFRLAIS